MNAEITVTQSFMKHDTYDATVMVFNEDAFAGIKIMCFSKPTTEQAIMEARGICNALDYSISEVIDETV